MTSIIEALRYPLVVGVPAILAAGWLWWQYRRRAFAPSCGLCCSRRHHEYVLNDYLPPDCERCKALRKGVR